jgi:M6 family metalloprotease-like protein
MKKIVFFVFATILFTTQHVFAVPAYPHPINYKLPDGSEITVQLRGDEWIRWAETSDGYTLLYSSNGFWEYAIQDENGDLKLSGVQAHNPTERTTSEQHFLINLPKGVQYSEAQIETKHFIRGITDDFLQKSGDAQRVSGNVRIPIILVGFADKPFTKTKADFELLFNQLNLTSTPNGSVPGSLRDYFLANSSGQMDLQVDVFGPYTLTGNLRVYTLPEDCSGGDSRNMARQAIDSAYANGANFAEYDPNNTGRVSTVHIIFAGYGLENWGTASCNHIWSHASSFSPPRNYNGKSIGNYSCSPEFRGRTGTDITYIGVVAHELGHSLLELPDFYNTGVGSSVDIGDWCLMAGGSWGDDGRTPSLLSAYGRVASGWVHEIELSEPTNITLPNPTVEDVVYRINTTTPNEYYLLENRQRTGWDAYVPGSGMLIYHVRRTSSDLSVWNSNRVNATANNRRYYVKQANCAQINGCNNNRRTDPWPQSGKTEFTDNTTPNMKSWAGADTEKPITNITHNTTNRTVSFKFMDGLEYSIQLSLNGTYKFADATHGYGEQTPAMFTITNDGLFPTGGLTIALSGTNPNNFTLSKTSISDIDVDSIDNFTIVPKTGLAVGTYTATVTVVGNNGISKSFSISFTVNQDVSVANFEKTATLKIYPNPTNGEITIKMENGEWRMENVEFFDMNGKCVYSHPAPRTSYSALFSINISHLPNGMYIVKIGTSTGSVTATARIVKH